MKQKVHCKKIIKQIFKTVIKGMHNITNKKLKAAPAKNCRQMFKNVNKEVKI